MYFFFLLWRTNSPASFIEVNVFLNIFLNKTRRKSRNTPRVIVIITKWKPTPLWIRYYQPPPHRSDPFLKASCFQLYCYNMNMRKVKRNLSCRYYWAFVYLNSVDKVLLPSLGIIPQMWLKALTKGFFIINWPNFN